MEALTAEFTPASELPPSQSREDELIGIIQRQAEALERMEAALYAQGPTRAPNLGVKPDGLQSIERKKIVEILSDLAAQISGLSSRVDNLSDKLGEMAKESEKAEGRIKDSEKEIRDIQESIVWIQESVPKLIAEDRKRLAAMESRVTVPQKTNLDRGEILVALLQAHGGKMPVKDARQKMRLTSCQFSQLLAITPEVKTQSSHLDKRSKNIILV